MNTIWKQLPTDLVKQIIVYDGTIVDRCGVYMNRISKYDERYKLLLEIPSKTIYSQTYGFDTSYRVCVAFKDKEFSCLIVHISKETIGQSMYKDFVYDSRMFSNQYNVDYIQKYMYGDTHKYYVCRNPIDIFLIFRNK
jgi:hypothetical protein